MWVWVEVVGIKKISPKFENEILMMMKNIREQKKKKKIDYGTQTSHTFQWATR